MGGAFALACALTALGCSLQQGRPRRIVLITLDTLRRDALLPETGEAPMPEFRALAARGAVFTRAYAASPCTQPTHASILTGRHPWQHGLTRNGMVLSAQETTLAERLRSSGFSTHAIVASFPLDPRFGFGQGFDTFEASFERRVTNRRWGGVALDDRRFYTLAASVTRRALALLDEIGAVDTFLWLHYFDPHAPYGDTGGKSIALPALKELAKARDPRLRTLLETARSLYLRDLASLDRALARLFRRLEADADHFETHVVVTADHGESFGEGGSLGHGDRLTPSQIEVPLLILSPALEPGIRDDVTGSVDLFTTVLALAGLPANEGEGRSLLTPAAGASAAFGMRRSYARPHDEWRIDGTRVVLQEPWFYEADDRALVTGNRRRAFFDDDPALAVDGWSGSPLRTLFGKFEEELAASRAEERVDPDTRDALRALGYVR